MKGRTRSSRPQVSSDVRAGGKPPGHGAKSAALRERAILALLSEKTLAAAATRSGVHERTLRRWIAEDEQFKQSLTAARQAAFEAGFSRVQALMSRAVDTLEDLLDAEKNPSVRLGAARTVAEMSIHQHDAETILKKLDEIEVRQREGSN